MRKRSDRTLAHHLRTIADLLERGGYSKFPIYLRTAAREMYEMNYRISQLEKRLKKLEQKR